MRIYYITSGGVWPHNAIDSYIIRALGQLPYHHKVYNFRPRLGPRGLIGDIRTFRPTLVLTLHGGRLPVNVVQAMRRLRIPLALWIVDDPYDFNLSRNFAPLYDFVFTNEECCVTVRQRQTRGRVFHLPLGAPDEFFGYETVTPQYQSDVLISGSAFYNRLWLVDQLAHFLKGLQVKIIGQWWHKLAHFNELRPFIHNGFVPPHELAKYYRGAKINLNIHRAHNARHIDGRPYRQPINAITPNSRTFEIAAVGGFQITEGRAGLPHYYVTEQEVVTYANPTNLQHKIMHYLQHPNERLEILLKAKQRTLRDHTYQQRLASLLAMVR
ncbi:MAG: glycosyltransferase [Clostridia bacterium]|nr:glycosyltransferase [Clostridia bacterium]